VLPTNPLKLAPETQTHALREYKKGLHILSNFESSHYGLLVDCEPFRLFVNRQINELNLSKVGEAYHNFSGGGFTAVVCLAESHLSIHTWPHINYATFDVYLSNHTQDNGPKAKAIYSSVLQFFDAQVLYENLVNR
jgi:S-adenosylmethionine decarboxylase